MKKKNVNFLNKDISPFQNIESLKTSGNYISFGDLAWGYCNCNFLGDLHRERNNLLGGQG